MKSLVIVRGGGDLASGTIHALYRIGYEVLVLEKEKPSALRREVAFAEAVYKGKHTVERVTAECGADWIEADNLLRTQGIAVLVDPEGKNARRFRPHIVVDTLGALHEQGLPFISGIFTVGFGSGFCAGVDVDCIVETRRGHNLGRIVYKGRAISPEPIPPVANGMERLLKAETSGVFVGRVSIGNPVVQGEVLGTIAHESGDLVEVRAPFDGILRGILHEGYDVEKGMRIAEVDPRGEGNHCYTISDRSRAIAGGVITAILAWEQERKR